MTPNMTNATPENNGAVPQNQYTPPQYPYGVAPPEPGSGEALAAMILGISSIVSFNVPQAVVALVLAGMSNKKQDSMGRERLSHAKAGKIMGIVGLAFAAGFIALYFIYFAAIVAVMIAAMMTSFSEAAAEKADAHFDTYGEGVSYSYVQEVEEYAG
ncbi:MAG: hypothetical protein FWG45_03685 [Oscillospiraceae bacterium]|nr:hypothetical protein [Oscillospiraceae bacterium]